MAEATQLAAEMGEADVPPGVRRAREREVSQTYHSGDHSGSALAELALAARDVWHSRDLAHQLVLRDVRIRYKQAVMGFGWALFMPLLIVGAGLLVRYAMGQVSGGGLEDAPLAGLAVKSLGWAFFVGAIGFATPSLIASQGLVSKVYFPREIIPLSTIVAQGFDSTIGAVLLAMLLPFLGAVLTPQLLWVPLLAMLLFLFTAASGLLLSCANLFFRDVKYIVQVLLTFGIFVTPVFVDPAMFGPTGARIVMLNPLAPFLEGLRLTVAHGHNLLEPLVVTSVKGEAILAWTPWDLAYGTTLALVGLVVSILIFRRAATRFAEYV